jgi:hypothetical protein
MALAEATVLVKLQFVRSVFLILCCCVVPALALGAGKGDNVTHNSYLVKSLPIYSGGISSA